MVGYVRSCYDDPENCDVRRFYIDPDNAADPWVYVTADAVRQLGLVPEQKVLYRAHRRPRYGWDCVQIATDLSGLSNCISPSDWQSGRVNRVEKAYYFVSADAGPMVMCLPSASSDGYEHPYVNQNVMFRAGPSEKASENYQQALYIRAMNISDMRNPPALDEPFTYYSSSVFYDLAPPSAAESKVVVVDAPITAPLDEPTASRTNKMPKSL